MIQNKAIEVVKGNKDRSIVIMEKSSNFTKFDTLIDRRNFIIKIELI